MAEDVVEKEVEKLAPLKASNGAAMVTDAKTGHILAMVGSKNYWDEKGGNFNVTTSNRQPGSSIKPLTFAAAFKEGFTPGSIVLDTPISYKNAWENYSPVNYDGRFHGPVTIRTALGSSYNIPAVKVLNEIGVNQLIQTAKDLGITTFTTPERYGLSLTLGGGEVKLVDMMSVYGTFSQLGKKYDAQPILKITDSEGKILEDNTNPEGKKVLESGVAYMINSILSDNKARTPAFGPNSLLVIPGHTVAVKTGTTDSKRDNWTFGYTPEYVVGTWVGNNDNSPMDPQLTSGITGASPIWHQIMVKLLENKPDIAFIKPSDISEGVINGRKDLILIGKISKSTLSNEKYFSQKSPAPDGRDKNITFTDPLNTYITNTSSQ
jgi:membrane peptidoglycan carboxypeptidase